MGALSVPGAVLHASSLKACSISARVSSASSAGSYSMKPLDMPASLLYKCCVHRIHLCCISVSTLSYWSFAVTMRGANFPVICLIAWNTFLDFLFA